MTKIVACVDGSAYAAAVCDFAALFADRMEAEVELLTVEESPAMAGLGDAAIRMGAARLSEHGFDRFSTAVAKGPFIEAVAEFAGAAALVVMGKRGVDRTAAQGRLGRHVEPVLRDLTLPACLVSQLFLPISRALVVLDSDPDHRRAMEFATETPILAELELELLVVDDGRHLAEEKLAAARGRLAGRHGGAYSTQAESPDRAIGEFAGGADLMVVSREMVFGTAGMLPGEAESFWRRRAPILVC